MTYVLVFLGMALLDIIWAKYIQYTANKKATTAANYAAILLALNAYVVIAYTSNPYNVIPAAMGAWVGTYIGSQNEWTKKLRLMWFTRS